MFKFIHCADIHLDSPLRGLARYEGAPADRIRNATRQALDALVNLAVDEGVEFIIIAGDVFDGDWRDYNTGLFFASRMSRLRDEGIRVFILAGNHDAASHISRRLQMPDNVRYFSTRRPETFVLEDIGAALHGQGFRSRNVSENLALSYPDAISGCYNVGILHTSATGRPGHEPYAPCRVEDLTAKGYDYWALGHVHTREILNRAPLILFPGNIQGRHIRETGDKGCTLVTVNGGSGAEIGHRSLDVVRWIRLSVDCSGARTGDDAVALVRQALETEAGAAGDRLLAVRVDIIGECTAHRDLISDPYRWTSQIRMAATDISLAEIWIEKVHLGTRLPIDIKKLASGDTPLGHLLRYVEEMATDSDSLALLAESLAPLKARLPSELRFDGDFQNLENPERIRELIPDIRQVLVSRLLAGRSEK